MFLSININQNYIYQGSLSSNIIRQSSQSYCINLTNKHHSLKSTKL